MESPLSQRAEGEMPTLKEWEDILRRLAALVDRLERALERLELEEEVVRDD